MGIRGHFVITKNMEANTIDELRGDKLCLEN
jgi:hypothetical protein